MFKRAKIFLPGFVFALPVVLSAQSVSIDEGAFRLTVNGEIAGREEFSIRRVGLGSEAYLILRGSVELDLEDGRRALTPAMKVTANDMAVTDYQMMVEGRANSEIHVRRSGRRFLAKVLSPEGEEVREFRAGPGSVLLDRDVAHQHHLLLQFLGSGPSVSLTVLSPESGQQVRMTFTYEGEEELRVGTELVRGRHYRLVGGDGDRDIWFDDQGRVLRIAVPERGYLAEREALG